jgi:hypothetical protein
LTAKSRDPSPLLGQSRRKSGNKKMPPLTNPPMASEGKELIWVGSWWDTLPNLHLTIECRMVEQKKPPLTHSQKASGGRVVGLSLVWGQRQPSYLLRYHNGGGGWKEKKNPQQPAHVVAGGSTGQRRLPVHEVI